MDAGIYRAIQEWAGELDGVFTLADLRVILGDATEAALYKRLIGLVDNGTLIKIKRGIYATSGTPLTVVSNRIEPKAYISTGTILAQSALIGSVPVRKIQAIKVGRPRLYRCALGVIEHLSISTQLYMGFSSVDGILCASPEKAFLDVCYYNYRGKRFSFDPASDVDLTRLRREEVEDFLEKYDRRFVNYFNRIWGDQW